MLATFYRINFHSHMVADDAAARKKFKEDRQAEAILKNSPRELQYLFFLIQLPINLQ
jgi:hypothetical protein